MLQSHMNAVEATILQKSRIPANAGHPLHMGTPRETFVKEFLDTHLSENIAVSTGEIIDAFSEPNQARNQFDIILYQKSYPKLNFGGEINGFLIESVVATIEIKSTLDASGIDQSVRAAHAAKILQPHRGSGITTGWIPPGVLNFVVAYNGPAHMQTVFNWMQQSHQKNGIPMPVLPSKNSPKRINTTGTALDGVFVLGKGFLKLDNTPASFHVPLSTDYNFFVSNTSENNLLVFFIALQEACNNLQGRFFRPESYLARAQFPNVGVI